MAQDAAQDGTHGVWQVWPDRGFLMNPDPLRRLDDADHAIPDAVVDRLESLACDLPHLLKNGRLRPTLDALPVVDFADLQGDGLDPRIHERLMLLYAYFASAYVLSPETAARLPPGVAAPLAQIAGMVDRPPILSYATMVLGNWRRKDPAGALDLDNLETLQTFTGLGDESWFTLVHVAIEARAASILAGIRAAFEAIGAEDDAGVLEALRAINRGIVAVVKTFHRMPQCCDPDVYYRDVRPYMFGFNGVIFEGAAEYQGRPQHLRGGSGAQSSIIPALNAALGVRHETSELTVHLDAMKTYMPAAHRQFIAAIDAARIRDYVRDRPPLADAYNACIRQLITFRRAHFYYAKTYIFEKSTNPVGTGGTMFMDFLSKLVEETQAHLL